MKSFKEYIYNESAIVSAESVYEEDIMHIYEQTVKISNIPKELKNVKYNVLGSQLTKFYIEFTDKTWKKPIFAGVSYKMKSSGIADDVKGTINVDDIDYKNGEIVNIYYMKSKNNPMNIELNKLDAFLNKNIKKD